MRRAPPTGLPFSNIKEGYYPWAEGIHLEMQSSILGRTVDPASERLWRDALRVGVH